MSNSAYVLFVTVVAGFSVLAILVSISSIVFLIRRRVTVSRKLIVVSSTSVLCATVALLIQMIVDPSSTIARIAGFSVFWFTVGILGVVFITARRDKQDRLREELLEGRSNPE